MKKTNFTNSHLSGGAKAIRRLGFVAACLALTSFFGVTQANAQTVDQVSEQTIAHVQDLFQQEEFALEAEVKSPPPGVETSSNELLVYYYQKSIKDWVKNGADFKDAMKDNLALISGNTGGSNAFMGAAPSSYGEPFMEGAEMKEARILIDEVDLEDQSDQDILDIFAYLRTLKNS